MTFATLRGVVSIAAIGIREVCGLGLVHSGGGLRSIHFAAFMRRAEVFGDCCSATVCSVRQLRTFLSGCAGA